MWFAHYLVTFCCLSVFADPCPKKCTCHSSWLRGVTNVVVDCSKKSLTTIPSRISPYVTSLVLNENFITELPANVFIQYKYMRELYLYKNFLSKIHKDAFKGLQRLTELSLHSNRLTAIENGTFSTLKNLRKLYLFTNYIKSINPGVFEGLEKVETLFLHENLLRSIPEGTFVPLEQLRVLTLYRNYLQVLFSGSLRGLLNLNSLYLHENKLKMIANGSFLGCTNLMKLQLGHNHLTNITKEMFIGLSRVSEIYLDNNRLIEITVSTFGDNIFPFVRKIVLLGNQIKNIEAGSFRSLGSLMVLSLSGNRLTELNVGMFSGLYSVNQLFLQDNRIEWIERNSFAGMKNLQQLYLFRNQILYIQENTFEGLSSLSELNLGVNNISGLANGAFNGLPRLLVLQLNSNRLTTIPSGAFRNLRHLYRLVVFYNSISFIAEGAFSHLEKLRSIVWYAPLSLVQSSKKLRLIKSNELQCDCNILWLKAWLSKTKSNSTIFCEKPEFLMGKNILSIDDGLFKCEILEKMHVRVEPKSSVILERSSHSLRCISNVLANFTWMKDGFLLPASDSFFLMTSGILFLRNTQNTSGGQYTCVAMNRGRFSAASVEVVVGTPPTMLSSRKELTFVGISDLPIILQCNASGTPSPLHIWFMNDVPLDHTRNYSFLRHNGGLLITRLPRTDSMTYRCEAHNELGFDFRTIILRVKQDQNSLGRFTSTCKDCLYWTKPVCCCSNEGNHNSSTDNQTDYWNQNSTLSSEKNDRTIEGTENGSGTDDLDSEESADF